MTAAGLYQAAKARTRRGFWQRVRAFGAWLYDLAPGMSEAQRLELEALGRDMADSPYGYALGDKVSKTAGDYVFLGWVMMRGRKRSGVIRYAVENQAGLVHIFNESQLTPGWPGDAVKDFPRG